MVVEPNMAKYEAYKTMHVDLKKAMGSGFYYQAIFIEYAIAEDRCRSALVCAGVKCVNNRGQELKLSAKINKLKSNSAFTAKYPRSRLTLELLDELYRDALVHNLANIPYNDEAVREVAERGKKLIDTLSNRVKSVNNYFKKLYAEQEKVND